jgi:hypothetical protein
LRGKRDPRAADTRRHRHYRTSTQRRSSPTSASRSTSAEVTRSAEVSVVRSRGR